MNTSIVEYSEIAMVLADLAGKYKGVVFDVSTIEGMTAAKAGSIRSNHRRDNDHHHLQVR